MSTSSFITRATRTIGCAVVVAATTLGLCGSAAVAHEPPPAPSDVSTGSVSATVWYATPLESLGGRTLAQYLADHETRLLGPSGG